MWSGGERDAKARATWDMCNPTETGPEGWRNEWGWLGLVPNNTRSVMPEGRGKGGEWDEIGPILAKAGHAMWKERNEWTVQWEKDNGLRVDRRKSGKIKKRKAQTAREPSEKKLEEQRQEAIKQKMADDLAAATRPGKLDPGRGYRKEPKAPTVKRAKPSKNRFKVSVRRACEAADQRERAEERAENSGRVRCGYQGCTREPTVVAMGCKRQPEAEPRCTKHESLKCRGNLVGCECRVNFMEPKKRTKLSGQPAAREEEGEEEEEEGMDEQTRREQLKTLAWMDGELTQKIRDLCYGDEITFKRAKGWERGRVWKVTNGRHSEHRDAFRIPDEIWVQQRQNNRRVITAVDVVSEWRKLNNTDSETVTKKRSRDEEGERGGTTVRGRAVHGTAEIHPQRQVSDGGEDEGVQEERHEQDGVECSAGGRGHRGVCRGEVGNYTMDARERIGTVGEGGHEQRGDRTPDAEGEGETQVGRKRVRDPQRSAVRNTEGQFEGKNANRVGSGSGGMGAGEGGGDRGGRRGARQGGSRQERMEGGGEGVGSTEGLGDACRGSHTTVPDSQERGSLHRDGVGVRGGLGRTGGPVGQTRDSGRGGAHHLSEGSPTAKVQPRPAHNISEISSTQERSNYGGGRASGGTERKRGRNVALAQLPTAHIPTGDNSENPEQCPIHDSASGPNPNPNPEKRRRTSPRNTQKTHCIGQIKPHMEHNNPDRPCQTLPDPKKRRKTTPKPDPPAAFERSTGLGGRGTRGGRGCTGRLPGLDGASVGGGPHDPALPRTAGLGEPAIQPESEGDAEGQHRSGWVCLRGEGEWEEIPSVDEQGDVEVLHTHRPDGPRLAVRNLQGDPKTASHSRLCTEGRISAGEDQDTWAIGSSSEDESPAQAGSGGRHCDAQSVGTAEWEEQLRHANPLCKDARLRPLSLAYSSQFNVEKLQQESTTENNPLFDPQSNPEKELDHLKQTNDGEMWASHRPKGQQYRLTKVEQQKGKITKSQLNKIGEILGKRIIRRRLRNRTVVITEQQEIANKWLPDVAIGPCHSRPPLGGTDWPAADATPTHPHPHTQAEGPSHQYIEPEPHDDAG